MDLIKGPITAFTGDYAFLSNWHPANVVIRHGATILLMPSVEHAYQAAKMERWDHAVEIQNTEHPRDAMRLGRSYPMVQNWDSVKLETMFGLLIQKFEPGTELAAKLKATGTRDLIEGHTGHPFWGARWTNDRWVGANWLGQLLMRIRKEILT